MGCLAWDKDNLPYNHNMILFFIEFGIPWIWKWDFIIKSDSSVDIPTLKRVFWVRWRNNFPKKGIADLYTQINKQALLFIQRKQFTSGEKDLDYKVRERDGILNLCFHKGKASL